MIRRRRGREGGREEREGGREERGEYFTDSITL